jgi:hypothetical protein
MKTYEVYLFDHINDDYDALEIEAANESDADGIGMVLAWQMGLRYCGVHELATA